MIIQHNIAAINSYRNLGINQSGLNKNLEKLSSGYKINRAGDDAAGLAISEAMRSQINGLNQAVSNANDSIGLIQTAEGALTETHSMLQRMTTLATQAANGTYNSVARANIQSEIDQLLDEIDRIANNTDFNGIKPLADPAYSSVSGKLDDTATNNGTVGGININAGSKVQYWSSVNADPKTAKMTFQIGPTQHETIKVSKAVMTSAALGLSRGKSYNGVSETKDGSRLYTTDTHHICVTGSDTTSANAAVSRINNAINIVSTYRAKLGAAQNRLEHTINNLKVTSENITAAESRIRDTDMADEITAFTKNNILLQASQSMLAQSNSVPQ
ncbi:MAG: flagellin, partial [Lachnospiraceae bacterium]|nr:flagellin [Lachnospiraceae bacterium]